MKKISKDGIELKRCPDCGQAGEGALIRKTIRHHWAEGVETQREYEAQLDVVSCSKCGAQVIDRYARLQMHEAWCRSNGILSPRQIRLIRNTLGLTIEDFARLLGFGSASVGRWERGMLVPNESSNRLMKLLRSKGVVRRLAADSGVTVPALGGFTARVVRADGSRADWTTVKFSKNYAPSESDRNRAATFRLRRGIA